MGQKVNPISLRLGIYRKWKSNWFLDSNDYGNFLQLNYEINKYFSGILRNSPVKSFFSHCVLAKNSLEKIYIFIFFYRLRKRKKPTKSHKIFNYKTKKQVKNFSKKSINKVLKKEIFLKKTNVKIINLCSITTKLNNFDIKQNKISNKNKLKLIQPKKNRIFNKKIKKVDLINKPFKLKRGRYPSIIKIKNSLESFLGTKVSLIFINSLSFIRFYTFLQGEKDLLLIFERQMMNFYRYDVKLVRDAVHISFIALFLKQPETLAKFIGYQLRRTPKNRRQTKLIQFYKKMMTEIIQERPEIEGLRITFKGRINGRKRANKMSINIGRLPLQTHSNCIEYGQSEGITIYGSIGVKVWIFYNKDFNKYLQTQYLKYFQYKKKK